MISDDRYPIFEKILSGETPAQACGGWSDTGKPRIPYVKRQCVLCDALLAMDATNQEKVKQMNGVTICVPCAKAIMELTPCQTAAMVGGKLMSMEEGFVQIQMLERRN